ncbi:hypothetical protein L211DRAFT_685343 [Terfezia boudieri ATCC MYA-4762]|uniref:Uncharacterized protein n=1 Tax=Terfezia boudieri ATCC MYA-4762 TaxID=1051890 RepID=A0A3N4LUP0_9PEZI|nr:hypothetical protein L211DRAFT_685343 [Terfezia boudieri ATCC MYA-4762]
MPLLLYGDWATFLQTWILRDRLQLVHVAMMRDSAPPQKYRHTCYGCPAYPKSVCDADGVTEGGEAVGAINRYASAKFEEFSGCGNDEARSSFQRDWEACIFGKPLTESQCAHLDGCFFFRQRAEDGVYVGRTACDLACTVGAARLRQFRNLAEFAEKLWSTG